MSMESSDHTATQRNDKRDDALSESTVTVPSAEEIARIKNSAKYINYVTPAVTMAMKKIAASVLNSLESTGGEALASDLIETGAIKLATEITIEVATNTIVRAAIIGILEAMGPIAIAADIALAVFAIIGAIYDKIDPHHYKDTYYRANMSMLQKQMVDQSRYNLYNQYKHQLETVHGEETESFTFPIPVRGTDVYDSRKWHTDTKEIVVAVTKYTGELLQNLTVNSQGEIIDYEALRATESETAKRLAEHPPEWNKFVHDCMQSVVPLNTRIRRTIACLDVDVEQANSLSTMWWICLIAGGTAAGVVASTRKNRVK